MYLHSDNDEFISLHDCHATKVLFENGVLTFVFEDGFWISPGHPENVTDKTVRTDSAEVQFFLEVGDEFDVNCYVFNKKFKKTIREDWQLSKLIECINDKNDTLEFLYQYKNYRSIMIECWLWSKRKPYHRECMLRLSVTDVKYDWNELQKDRVW